MSVIVDGKVVDSEISKGAKGGTELMRERLLHFVDSSLLKGVAIHFSRVREHYPSHKNIYYAHDMADDAEAKVCEKHGAFDVFVFVSYWQRDQYLSKFGLPYDKCYVIENATEFKFVPKKHTQLEKIGLIYHTTPHRGLALLPEIYGRLRKEFGDAIDLKLFSSFNVYGQSDSDEVTNIVKAVESHGNVQNFGFRPNHEVVNHLSNSNIFVFPSIWAETSCLAMIEAMKADCYVVHPDFAALSETGMNVPQSVKFRMSNYGEAIADRCFETTANLIEGIMYGNEPISAAVPTPIKYDIEAYKMSWEKLLKDLRK